jgi:hypothetical protein
MENGQLVVLIAASSSEPQLAESRRSVVVSCPRMNEVWRREQATECYNVRLGNNE